MGSSESEDEPVPAQKPQSKTVPQPANPSSSPAIPLKAAAVPHPAPQREGPPAQTQHKKADAVVPKAVVLVTITTALQFESAWKSKASKPGDRAALLKVQTIRHGLALLNPHAQLRAWIPRYCPQSSRLHSTQTYLWESSSVFPATTSATTQSTHSRCSPPSAACIDSM